MDLIVPEVESVDTVLVINPDTRIINVGSGLLLGVETDNDAERVEFQCPKIVGDNLDLSQYHIYIHYQNAKGETGKYLCEDVEDAGENITFSWLLSQKVTIFKGVTKFLVCAKKTDAETIVWNTTLASGNVLEGLAVDEDIVQQNDDVIEQILLKIEQIEVSGEFISRDEIYLGYAMSQDKVYSGHAGDYGIDVAKIIGAYKQDGTPTPDNPVEPEFFSMENFNTNGGNLFDASKLPTTSQGGVTLTNNGDGSFTFSGSGTMSSALNVTYLINHERTLQLLKEGNIYLVDTPSKLNQFIEIACFGTDNKLWLNLRTDVNRLSGEVTEEMLNDENLILNLYLRLDSGKTITPGTIYPMLYQDGDGIWYPFNASNTLVSLELRALPDGTADVWEDGNITRNVAKVTLDGSNNKYILQNYITPSSATNNFGYYAISISGIRSVGKTSNTKSFLVNKLKKVINQSVAEEMSCYLYEKQLVVFTNQYTTKDDFNSYLQSNPIDVYYPLVTPTTKPLAIPTLTSYYPFTNAWCDSELEPKLIEWHVNNKINYIEKLINEK